MSVAALKEFNPDHDENITREGADTCTAAHDYDLVRELIQRKAAIRRYETYIASIKEEFQLQDFWKALRDQELANIRKLQQFVIRRYKSSDLNPVEFVSDGFDFGNKDVVINPAQYEKDRQ
jgi:hypothetical protein